MALIKSRFFFLIVISILGKYGFSQIELQNKIVDFSTLAPLENASIYVKNTTIGTVSNANGRFVLLVPQDLEKDTLVVSCIGFKSYKIPINEFNREIEITLEEDVASLDEILVVAEARPTTGNEIVLKALEKLADNLPDSTYIQKGFLRHKERNKIEFKWLIESAITVCDSGYLTPSKQYLKVNVDEVRKSFDLRDVDSLFSYASYLNQTKNNKSRLKKNQIKRQEVSTKQLKNAIKWNDNRVNGLQNIFHGKLNLLRNASASKALFGKDVLKTHQFKLDTILVDNNRKLYKLKINEGTDFIGLNTEGIYNEGYKANGWLYIYYDNYAIKKIEYELIAASESQKIRSKALFDTQINHKLSITYKEFSGKMYPHYIYYETPKLVNVGLKTNKKVTEEEIKQYNNEVRYYYTVQEILFTEVIFDKQQINSTLKGNWDMDIFSPKPYNKVFWENYNVLLESEEEEQLIRDLTQKATLFKD